MGYGEKTTMINRTNTSFLVGITIGIFIILAIPFFDDGPVLAFGAPGTHGEGQNRDRIASVRAAVALLMAIDNKLGAISESLQKTQISSENDHALLNKKECDGTKEGIGTFLYLADLSFKESKESEGEEKEKADEAAILLSTLSANYSTVYSVLCKS